MVFRVAIKWRPIHDWNSDILITPGPQQTIFSVTCKCDTNRVCSMGILQRHLDIECDAHIKWSVRTQHFQHGFQQLLWKISWKF
ncbi:hypothetical protein MT325_m076R [Paramecium bursaria chlorella virus MT325]|uniref:Uncharacterized protein m076R n=1 Tax=Paramecium bursaria Chlorella virus MT325 TaxID=346932 RepID=A7ITF6_PBCVM|nr:hypothetical protein MT325_m076R [Paramecium bursaria chlorella virus MT325]